jgi:hypothetical protein
MHKTNNLLRRPLLKRTLITSGRYSLGEKVRCTAPPPVEHPRACCARQPITACRARLHGRNPRNAISLPGFLPQKRRMAFVGSLRMLGPMQMVGRVRCHAYPPPPCCNQGESRKRVCAVEVPCSPRWEVGGGSVGWAAVQDAACAACTDHRSLLERHIWMWAVCSKGMRGAGRW